MDTVDHVYIVNQIIALILIFLNDDDDDENWSLVDQQIARFMAHFAQYSLNIIPRLENYVEQVIPSYSDELFKSHFRYVQLYVIIYII